MTTAQMITRVKDRTFHNNDDKIIGELNSAKDWAFTRIFNSENGPDLLMTSDGEFSLPTRTREYDVANNLTSTGTVYGFKQLWIKFSSDTNFTPMVNRDEAEPQFRSNDVYPTSDTTTVAVGHPVYYDVVNFAKVRFAPPLPANSTIRVDYWLKPPDIDPVANPTLTYSQDIPEPVHEVIVDKATSQIFSLLDDSRWAEWESKAERRLTDALYLLRGRVQGPVEIRPFRIRRKRWI